MKGRSYPGGNGWTDGRICKENIKVIKNQRKRCETALKSQQICVCVCVFLYKLHSEDQISPVSRDISKM